MKAEFLQIIEVNQGIIYKVSKMYRNSKEDQEDLFQEIVFQLWKSFSKFRGASKVSTWMYRIALNTAMASFRKKAIPIEYNDHPYQQSDLMENTEVSENEERMYDSLRQLNDSDKAIISLFLEDYSYSEIAEITGITENNVGVRINRIKSKLKTILNQ
ncbi:sigma-70 family RNA polymerase sigma factor [uncultured Roseivirga sp.]|mgnify:FL=1|uniref:sigma-70 family RNA polymerase sigma factor n=1 Tax=uncultured Roseivirga sp. TaxID=543088 RepID=UPI0030D8BC27|tara:strand:- start:69601 stop:70074 length:474 start_codon:yes stop_codon:yes gene_type:complete